MENYAVKYLDRSGKAKTKEFKTDLQRWTWVEKSLESGAASEILAWSDPQD